MQFDSVHSFRLSSKEAIFLADSRIARESEAVQIFVNLDMLAASLRDYVRACEGFLEIAEPYIDPVIGWIYGERLSPQIIKIGDEVRAIFDALSYGVETVNLRTQKYSIAKWQKKIREYDRATEKIERLTESLMLIRLEEMSL